MENLSFKEVSRKLSKLTCGLDYVGDAIFLIDSSGQLCYANPRACELFGYSQEELIALNRQPSASSFNMEWWAKHWHILQASETVSFETNRKTRNGNLLLLEISANRVVFEGQEYSLELMRDITRRKSLEDERPNLEKSLKGPTGESPDITVCHDKNLQKIFTDPVYHAPLEQESAPLQDHMDDLWLPTNISIEDYTRYLKSVLETGQAKSILVESLNNHGQLISHSLRIGTESDSNGKVTGSLAIGRNIGEQRQAELQMRQREQYLRTLLDNFPFMVWLKDADSTLLAANTAYAKVAGVPSTDDLEGKTDFDFFPRELAQQYVDGDREAMHSDKPIGTICALRNAEGEYSWIESYKSPLVIDGQVVGTLGYARDVTETLQREREYHSLIENSPNSIVRFDQDCKRVFLNARTAEYYDVPPDFLLGKTPREFPDGASSGEYEEYIRAVFSDGANRSFDFHWQTREGQLRIIHTLLAAELDTAGKVMSVIAVEQDVTETVENQQRIHHLAYFDSLTDLPNRTLLIDRLNQTIAEARRNPHYFGLMMLDLDRFKEINDTLGHAIGDALLCEVARRLENCVRGYDTVARLGGDEFAILLPEIRGPEDVSSVAGKVLDAFTMPFLILANELFATASIGIAVYPSDSEQADDLLKYADSAMYHAKKQGRNNFQYYSAAMTIRASERMDLETSLRKALQKEEFELYYQPQVDLPSGRVVGVEVLLRWHHGNGGLIMPDQFIGVAEDSGLIIGIGEWVISKSCQMAVQWNKDRANPFTFAINLSTRQFLHNDLVGSIDRILEETGCKPEWLKLEITESLLLEDTANIRKMLQELDARGLCISIDDFGTGYSALGYLNRFPVSQLKIDQSFVQDITVNPDKGLLVQAIISMALSLRKSLVAEGVETTEQAEYLTQMGCSQAQGYLFGKPMPYEQLKAAYWDEE